MKNRHLFSLLDESYTTIEVVFTGAGNPVRAPKGSGFTVKDGTVHMYGIREDGTDAPLLRGTRYTYKAPKAAGIAKGDSVVVDTPSSGLVIATVAEVHPAPQIDVDADFDYRWIVQKIDFAAYQQQIDKEAKFNATLLDIERVKQREALLIGFRNSLPEDSEARRLFDSTVKSLESPPIEGTHVDKTV